MDYFPIFFQKMEIFQLNFSLNTQEIDQNIRNFIDYLRFFSSFFQKIEFNQHNKQINRFNMKLMKIFVILLIFQDFLLSFTRKSP